MDLGVSRPRINSVNYSLQFLREVSAPFCSSVVSPANRLASSTFTTPSSLCQNTFNALPPTFSPRHTVSIYFLVNVLIGPVCSQHSQNSSPLSLLLGDSDFSYSYSIKLIHF